MGIKTDTLSPKENKNRQLAASVSLVVGILLMLLKFWAHNLTGSQGVFSDAMESIVNVVAAGLALTVIYYAAQPADEGHPYGHGKAEYFSSAFEGGLISFAGVFIIIEAATAFLTGVTLQKLGFGIAIVAGAGLANLVLGWYLIRVGRSNGSIALKASGEHVIADFWTSVAVIGGLGLVYLTGYTWIDIVIAGIVGGLLTYKGAKLVFESVGGLLDQEDPAVLERLAEVFRKHVTVGIIQIHNVKVIRSGHYHHIDAHLVVPEFWNIQDVHEKIATFENAVISDYEYGGEMNYHLDPCRKAYCSVCDLDDCPIREKKFNQRIPVDLTHMRAKEEPAEYRDLQ